MSQLLGGTRAPAFRFDDVGNGFDGKKIIDVRDVQQYDNDLKLPLFWPAPGSASRRPTTDTKGPNGENLNPVMQLKITVDTEVIDPTVEYDDGHRSVYLKGQALDALRADLRRSRSRDVVPGGRLSMRLIEKEAVDPRTGKRRGIPKNIYAVTYEPPTAEEPATESHDFTRDAHQAGLRNAQQRAAARAQDEEPPF